VTIADLSPIGRHFLETFDKDLAFIPSSTGDGNGSILNPPSVFQSDKIHVDTDDNGVINASDITPLGQLIGTQHFGWEGTYSLGETSTPLTFSGNGVASERIYTISGV